MGGRVLVLALVLSFSLVGCVSSGTVIGKGHDRERFIPVVEDECDGYQGCTVHTVQETVPECWRLDLRQGDDTGQVCVDEDVWQRVAVGSYWPG